jgi:uncharacterized protein (DUF1330 family)
MNSKQRYLLIIFLIVISAVAAGGLWVAISGWPPIIIRDRQYNELIEGFHRADRKYKTGGGSEAAGWGFQIQVPGRRTTALVHVPSSIGVVTIKYDDEDSSRPLYRSAEYTSPVEIRTKGSVLYVHWVEPLFGYNHWVLAYDLADRSEIGKRRIDPNDLH